MLNILSELLLCSEILCRCFQRQKRLHTVSCQCRVVSFSVADTKRPLFKWELFLFCQWIYFAQDPWGSHTKVVFVSLYLGCTAFRSGIFSTAGVQSSVYCFSKLIIVSCGLLNSTCIQFSASHCYFHQNYWLYIVVFLYSRCRLCTCALQM